MKKADIKEVSEKDGVVTVKFEKEENIDLRKLQMRWSILKDQEARLKEEKEKLKEIAKQAKITLK